MSTPTAAAATPSTATDTATDTATRTTEREVRTSACRLCAVGCGVHVTVEGDEVLEVRGDMSDPWSAGYTCAKGRAAPDFHRRADRLDRPLIRSGDRLVVASWDAALDDIAERTRALIDEHGVGSIADYVGTGGPIDPAGYAMAHGFFRALKTTQHYSALSIDCASQPLVAQLITGAQLSFQPDLEHTPLLIALGVNTVVSHGHGLMIPNPLVHVRDLRARGAQLIVVDPRRSETAHHADVHLAIRPTADPALLAHLVRAVLSSSAGADEAFLAACADRAGVERLRAAVAPFDRATTAAICDVPADDLDRVVAMVLGAGRVAIETGTGTTLNRSSNATEWMAWALAGVTGSLDRRGGNTFNPGFLRPFEDGLPAGRGDLLPGPPSRPDLPPIVNGEMPCAALTDQIVAGAVRALFVRVGNLALALPDAMRFADVARGLDLLVAIDVRHTETTALATHVLPMTDHLERGDLVTGYLQPTPFMRWAPAVVGAVGERRAQWWMFAELSRRLDLPLFGSASRAAELTGPTLDDETIAASMLGRARHGWDEVIASEHGVRDDSLAPGWLIPDRLPRPLDLAPIELAGELTAVLHARTNDPTHPLVLVNRRTPNTYNSLGVASDRDTLQVHPEDATRYALDDGRAATVTSASGTCVATIEVTERIRRGVVSLPHGRPGANVNRLTSSAGADRLSGMPLLSGIAVSVAPVVAPVE